MVVRKWKKIGSVLAIITAMAFIVPNGIPATVLYNNSYNSFGTLHMDYNTDGLNEVVIDANDINNSDNSSVDSAGEYLDDAYNLIDDAEELVS